MIELLIVLSIWCFAVLLAKEFYDWLIEMDNKIAVCKCGECVII
jgi:hypothetical protein